MRSAVFSGGKPPANLFWVVELLKVFAEWKLAQMITPNVELTRLAVGQSGGAKRNES